MHSGRRPDLPQELPAAASARRVPVTILIGAGVAAGNAAHRALARMLEHCDAGARRGASARWSWLTQNSGTLPGPVDKSRLLSSACLCCGGKAELGLQLNRELSVAHPDRIVMELMPGTHLASLLDLLRSVHWRERLDVRHVLLALDHSIGERAHAAEAFAMRLRAQLMACTHLLLCEPEPNAEQLERWLADRPFADTLPRLRCASLEQVLNHARSEDSTGQEHRADDAAFVQVKDQSTSENSSWSLRAIDCNHALLEARWPADIVFDRRSLIAAFNTFCNAVTVNSGQATFATARDWYEWRHEASGSRWNASDFRAEMRLRIEFDDDESARMQLAKLRAEIENATPR